MSGGDPSGALRDIQTLFSEGMLGGLTDRQLLERFVNRKDSSSEDAFTILLERHGPMVWGVCVAGCCPNETPRPTLRFQATPFLVLVRRASTVRVDDSLGPWLYGVSRRVAARARATSLSRRAHETGGVEAVAGPAPDPDRAERLAILDEEIGRLPERHCAAVVLCDLEGLPHEEAARRLGCPVGTVESRLSRGRQRLRDRLARRGIAPAAAALWAEMAREASAAMPAVLIRQSARFVTSSPAAGAVPVAVTALAEGVIQMMWLARLKPLVAIATALILATAVVAVQGRQQPAPEAHKITVTTLRSKAITLTQAYVCKINSHHHIEVRAPEAGYLGAIQIREGQTVKRDDLLFHVRPLLDKEKPDTGNQEKVDSIKAPFDGMIKAPFDGMVDRVPHQQGSLVQTGETLTTLSDNSLMWVYFNVPEARYLEYKSANLDQHKDDLKIELILANGNKFDQPGKLGAIGADFNTATGNVAFRADFPNPQRLLRHGQTGNVLISQVQNDAIVIPQRATLEKLAKRYVYVVDKDDVAHQREIVIQKVLEDRLVIKKGLGVDDKIVVDGVRLVRDGDKVEYEDRQLKKVVANPK